MPFIVGYEPLMSSRKIDTKSHEIILHGKRALMNEEGLLRDSHYDLEGKRDINSLKKKEILMKCLKEVSDLLKIKKSALKRK